MTPSGLIIMIASVTTVASVWSWCIYKVLTQPNDTSNLELHTPDMDQPE